MTVMWSSAFALAGSRMYRASSRTGASSLYVRTRHANKEGTRLHQMHRFTTTSSSTTNNEMNYVDKWLESIIKPKSFYEKHAEGPIRRYFYNVDFQGRLFLEETVPKNITTSIKDEKFLNFFFSRIRIARESDIEFLTSEGIHDDYPFVSLCGKEVNHIRPVATPIVFHAMVDGMLYYGGSLKQSFHPKDLAISWSTGRLYHRVESQKGVTTFDYGLIRSSVAVTLSEQIQTTEEGDTGLGYFEDGIVYPISELPTVIEPGQWGFRQGE